MNFKPFIHMMIVAFKGVILRRLQDDPELTGVTHIVVDEVHERQWQIDFLLIALRKLIQTTRRDLKIILVRFTKNNQVAEKGQMCIDWEIDKKYLIL